MAYGYFPTNYNPFPQPMQYQVPQVVPQTQQSNLIHVQSENQAREWRVDLGSSVMFIDDNAPFIYTKTAGSSQLEPAVFKRFKVLEDSGTLGAQNNTGQPQNVPQVDLSEYMTKAEFEPVRALIDDIQKRIKELTYHEQPIEQPRTRYPAAPERPEREGAGFDAYASAGDRYPREYGERPERIDPARYAERTLPPEPPRYGSAGYAEDVR